MILADVMEEIATRLETIDGLRAFGYPPDTLTPPAAVVSYPETYTFDDAYARGADRATVPIVVVVGRVSDRASRDAISAYLDGAGTRSLKQVLETGTYTAFDSLRLMSAEFDVVSIGGTDYLAATIDVDIVGRGAE